ncbi:uncharacterized protein SPAPADRAFT_58607 [Spathaspora passalidarum NRRL Y-27907]|uniref:SnoaL-like domain-containing protein n=1 Tax=Spathaspora passalidarum (strain NRRL Y-27907 / 11-Y1) TaxID=619300 RepID=G3AGQ6_SPAPN|nr:uncharacterized protein SPAPADRAFT_58607 [Spathaspora passalidarum NRRL Y-27907]EGW35389.1 hypothetical protein SPAPADRAFT_58607 [Spathaspora passalidarum NRRL Y-27907]
MTKYSPTITSSLKKFITDFYLTSDVAPPAALTETRDPYLNFFTEDAPLIMGSTRVKGHNEIIELRKGMWKVVTKRHHVVENVASVEDNNTLLINGYVDYTLINGKSITSEWAARMHLTKDLKMEFYQVYLDPSLTAKALAED